MSADTIRTRLWCVHLRRSDEAIAARTWFEACIAADDHNLALGYMDAVVAEWPHTPEGHTQDVADHWLEFMRMTAERRRVVIAHKLVRQIKR